jgi:hypothetical protein
MLLTLAILQSLLSTEWPPLRKTFGSLLAFGIAWYHPYRMLYWFFALSLYATLPEGINLTSKLSAMPWPCYAISHIASFMRSVSYLTLRVLLISCKKSLMERLSQAMSQSYSLTDPPALISAYRLPQEQRQASKERTRSVTATAADLAKLDTACCGFDATHHSEQVP